MFHVPVKLSKPPPETVSRRWFIVSKQRGSLLGARRRPQDAHPRRGSAHRHQHRQAAGAAVRAALALADLQEQARDGRGSGRASWCAPPALRLNVGDRPSWCLSPAGQFRKMPFALRGRIKRCWTMQAVGIVEGGGAYLPHHHTLKLLDFSRILRIGPNPYPCVPGMRQRPSPARRGASYGGGAVATRPAEGGLERRACG
jgi:hypothetical protein